MITKLVISDLKRMKETGEKIACLTSYDASFARLQDEAGIDVLLVGDSLGMVLHGDKSTRNVTMDDMVYHTRLVSNVRQRALVISDMPYQSYTSTELAVENAKRLVNEGGTDIVKLEGGEEISDIVAAIKNIDIPVCGHLGLTPQSFSTSDGFKVQATTEDAAEKLKQDALLIQQAGCDCMVFECIPAEVAKEVTQALNIPTIGIGAGVDCDGQVLVLHDMLGITGKKFRFLKNFLKGNDSIADAIKTYISEVKNKSFPASEHFF
ncbi:MAG: 3-methyl-2-oxobutanoate hydroxymethyltransferase [Proteobacteria bacterium]|nr:3-methyl-2-oxobutanoate hydroxymethyltransferase [Pseudomonadota bacterium]